jgi:hypothetical protein
MRGLEVAKLDGIVSRPHSGYERWRVMAVGDVMINGEELWRGECRPASEGAAG